MDADKSITTLADLINQAPADVFNYPAQKWQYQCVREGGVHGYEFDRIWTPYKAGSRMTIHRIGARPHAQPFWHPHATALAVLVLPDVERLTHIESRQRTAYCLDVGIGPSPANEPKVGEPAYDEMRAGRGVVQRVASVSWHCAPAGAVGTDEAQLYTMDPGMWHDVRVLTGEVHTLCIFAPDGMPVGSTDVRQVLEHTVNLPALALYARRLMQQVRGGG